jgi:hypothetical protein
MVCDEFLQRAAFRRCVQAGAKHLSQAELRFGNQLATFGFRLSVQAFCSVHVPELLQANLRRSHSGHTGGDAVWIQLDDA